LSSCKLLSSIQLVGWLTNTTRLRIPIPFKRLSISFSPGYTLELKTMPPIPFLGRLNLYDIHSRLCCRLPKKTVTNNYGQERIHSASGLIYSGRIRSDHQNTYACSTYVPRKACLYLKLPNIRIASTVISLCYGASRKLFNRFTSRAAKRAQTKKQGGLLALLELPNAGGDRLISRRCLKQSSRCL